MARNSKKKLAIFAGTSKCLIYAEAKYCASEMPGEIKYYECSRTEYCCAFGCCVTPGLHFHHLWYYWILVIIMFLVCSGGGWWYRYWLQGRYRAAASAIPTRSSNGRSQSSLRNAPYQAQQARITYNSARNTVLLHRMWKGPPRNTAAAPAYNGNATTSTHYQNMNVVYNDANCPYYQLYGPPPSYETVIAQTRGKITDPTTVSPESASSAARLNDLQTANVIPNPSVPQCFFYTCNPPSRLVDGNSSIQCTSDNASSRHLDNHHEGVVPYAHFSQYYAANGGGGDGGGAASAVGQNTCLSLEYPEASGARPGMSGFDQSYQSGSSHLPPPGYSTDGLPDGLSENAENTVARGGGYAMPRHTTEGRRDAVVPWNDRSALIAAGAAIVAQNGSLAGASQQRRVTTAETHRTPSPKSEASDVENEPRRIAVASPVIPVTFRERNLPRERTDYGGSLRLPGRHTGGVIYQSDSFQRILSKSPGCPERRGAFDPATASGSSSGPRARDAESFATSSSQSNPSNNNVILERFIFESAPPPPTAEEANVEGACGHRAMNRSTNFDLESKQKLDRSRSLD